MLGCRVMYIIDDSNYTSLTKNSQEQKNMDPLDKLAYKMYCQCITGVVRINGFQRCMASSMYIEYSDKN